MTLIMLNTWLKDVSADKHHHDPEPSAGSRRQHLSSRSGKAQFCDCNSQGPWKPIFRPSAKVKSLPLHLPPPSQSYTSNFPSLENHDTFNNVQTGLSGQYPLNGQSHSSEQFPTPGHPFPTSDHFPNVPVPTGGENLTPGNRHMIHVHLIPHLYVPIMKQPGGSEDHKIQENNHFPPPSQYQHQDVSNAPPPTSAELSNQSLEPQRPEKHIEENHIIENHYDEFGNPYDPNQSGEVNESDEGEITNVDIHTYSSDDQGGSSHTHYTKNDGGSHESYEQTSPSGTGELSVDHGAQSSSYESSNSYYTIPPDVNIHHYNMHREYDHLLSREPNLHDLNDYNPKPIVLSQYEVHENTEEDTSNNNLSAGHVEKKPTPTPPPSTPNHNDINTNQLNLGSSDEKVPDKKYQYAKQYVKELLDHKHRNPIRLPNENHQHHDTGMRMIISPNTQLKHNSFSPEHHSFSRVPSYFLDQSQAINNNMNSNNNNNNYPMKIIQQSLNTPLNIPGGHFPFKSVSVNNEKLPAITLSNEKIHVRTNPKFLNPSNPFNHRLQFNNKVIIPSSAMKSPPSTANSLAPYVMQDGSFFNSKDFLKPLYSFQNLPELQPLFKADASNRNNIFFPQSNKNFNMVKLKPQKIAEYPHMSSNRQNYVRTVIMNRQDVFRNLESMKPPPPAQKQTWNKQYPYKQVIPDSYAKITLPKSIYHLNLIKTPMLSSSSNILDQRRAAVGLVS